MTLNLLSGHQKLHGVSNSQFNFSNLYLQVPFASYSLPVEDSALESNTLAMGAVKTEEKQGW